MFEQGLIDRISAVDVKLVGDVEHLIWERDTAKAGERFAKSMLHMYQGHVEAALGVDSLSAEGAGLAITALQKEVTRLTAQVEEQQFTLLAEQGNPEGAPSPGWKWRGRHWCKELANGVVLEIVRFRDGWRWFDGQGNTGEAPYAREAMKRAEKVMEGL